MSEEQQKEFLNVNEVYYGLRFLVGMADQAEACLKVWESILFKDGNNIAALSFFGKQIQYFIFKWCWHFLFVRETGRLFQKDYFR